MNELYKTNTGRKLTPIMVSCIEKFCEKHDIELVVTVKSKWYWFTDEIYFDITATEEKCKYFNKQLNMVWNTL